MAEEIEAKKSKQNERFDHLIIQVYLTLKQLDEIALALDPECYDTLAQQWSIFEASDAPRQAMYLRLVPNALIERHVLTNRVFVDDQYWFTVDISCHIKHETSPMVPFPQHSSTLWRCDTCGEMATMASSMDASSCLQCDYEEQQDGLASVEQRPSVDEMSNPIVPTRLNWRLYPYGPLPDMDNHKHLDPREMVFERDLKLALKRSMVSKEVDDEQKLIRLIHDNVIAYGVQEDIDDEDLDALLEDSITYSDDSAEDSSE